MPRARNIIDTASVEAVSRTSNATPPELNEAGFDPADIQVVKPDRMETKAKEAAFMQEYIEIEIEPGTEDNDAIFVHLGHNGSTQMVERGKVQRVRRRYLYSALMAKQVVVSTGYGKKGDGQEFNRLSQSVKTCYRARLVSDNNHQLGGSKWVQSVMAEASGMH